ncbi:MAG TPA: hypothetical protein VFV66_02350 [Nonomuraea sp.]|nr:hypothetical protein [Nonomuraea sp.]
MGQEPPRVGTMAGHFEQAFTDRPRDERARTGVVPHGAGGGPDEAR